MKANNETYLQSVCEYFLLRQTPENSPKIILQLDERFTVLLRKIVRKLELGSFAKEDCIAVSKQIDELISLAAELSMRKRDDLTESLAKIKDKLWYLLESLEQYCQETYKITIW